MIGGARDARRTERGNRRAAPRASSFRRRSHRDGRPAPVTVYSRRSRVFRRVPVHGTSLGRRFATTPPPRMIRAARGGQHVPVHRPAQKHVEQEQPRTPRAPSRSSRSSQSLRFFLHVLSLTPRATVRAALVFSAVIRRYRRSAIRRFRVTVARTRARTVRNTALLLRARLAVYTHGRTRRRDR